MLLENFFWKWRKQFNLFVENHIELKISTSDTELLDIIVESIKHYTILNYGCGRLNNRFSRFWDKIVFPLALLIKAVKFSSHNKIYMRLKKRKRITTPNLNKQTNVNVTCRTWRDIKNFRQHMDDDYIRRFHQNFYGDLHAVVTGCGRNVTKRSKQ